MEVRRAKLYNQDAIEGIFNGEVNKGRYDNVMESLGNIRIYNKDLAEAKQF